MKALTGGASARPSVFCNQGETFTPVAAPRQPCIRIGFPSGRCAAAYKTLEIQRAQRIARSTESGFPLKAVNPPDTEFGRRFATYVTRCCESSAEKADRNFIFRALSPLAAVAFALGGFFSLISFGIGEVTRS